MIGNHSNNHHLLVVITTFVIFFAAATATATTAAWAQSGNSAECPDGFAGLDDTTCRSTDTGALFWTVQGESMEPTFSPNDTLVIAANETFDTIEEGKVIVFRTVNDTGATFAAHRVFENITGDPRLEDAALNIPENSTVWVLLGDNNRTPNNGEILLEDTYVGTALTYIPADGDAIIPIPPAPVNAAESPDEETTDTSDMQQGSITETDDRSTTTTTPITDDSGSNGSSSISSSGGSGRAYLSPFFYDANNVTEQNGIPIIVDNASSPNLSNITAPPPSQEQQPSTNITYEFASGSVKGLVREMQAAIFNDPAISTGNKYHIDRVINTDISNRNLELEQWEGFQRLQDCWFELVLYVNYTSFNFHYNIDVPCVDRPPREQLPVDNSTTTADNDAGGFVPPDIGGGEPAAPPVEEEEQPPQQQDEQQEDVPQGPPPGEEEQPPQEEEEPLSEELPLSEDNDDNTGDNNDDSSDTDEQP